MHVQALRSVCGKGYVSITYIFSDGTKDLQNVVNRLRVFVKLKGQLCLQCFDAVGWAAGRASGL